MEIKHEDILITQKYLPTITQKDYQEDNEQIRRFIEASLTSLEMKFGQPASVAIRQDIEIDESTINHIRDFGGNKTEPIFAHVINAKTSKNYKIIIAISVQEPEIQCEKIKFIDRIKNIFKNFWR